MRAINVASKEDLQWLHLETCPQWDMSLLHQERIHGDHILQPACNEKWPWQYHCLLRTATTLLQSLEWWHNIVHCSSVLEVWQLVINSLRPNNASWNTLFWRDFRSCSLMLGSHGPLWPKFFMMGRIFQHSLIWRIKVDGAYPFQKGHSQKNHFNDLYHFMLSVVNCLTRKLQCSQANGDAAVWLFCVE